MRLRVTSTRAEVRWVAHGVKKTVLAWGAVNARFPARRVAQARFRLRYGGRLGGGSCGPYDGPALPWLVVACKARDGSYWALQRWRRDLPLFGQAAPWRVPPDLRLSHWRGPLAVLTVKQDWAYRRYDHLYGSVTYRGRPMHGFRTTRYGAPRDRFGVLIYIDTFDSGYGRGWRREMGFVTHRPRGIFCYGFYGHVIPGLRPFPPGNGERYRATAVGPGVLPDMRWQAEARGPYRRTADRRANAEQRVRYADGLCRPN